MSVMLHNGDHAEFEVEWAGRDPKERPDWPLPSFDARDWAEAFMKGFGSRREDIDEDLMIGWFANSLMRGFDEACARVSDQSRAAGETEGLDPKDASADPKGDAHV